MKEVLIEMLEIQMRGSCAFGKARVSSEGIRHCPRFAHNKWLFCSLKCRLVDNGTRLIVTVLRNSVA